ncbi:hypothetical protein [Streptomyces sp. 1222.5]|uniref:hypothetical protein n=1 Tax=Streptomyces sp. 1222.5 TaxID=1881026 RepID=UPI003D714AE2
MAKNLDVDPRSAQEQFNDIDKNGDGEISVQEFRDWFAGMKKQHKAGAKHVRLALKFAKGKPDQKITLSEFKELMGE